jgi:hypothetical protein
MGWLKSKEDLPPELRDMDPADIVAAVKRSKELETELAAQKTANTELSSKFETFSTEFDTKVEAKVTELVAKARGESGGGSGGGGNGGGGGSRTETLADFLTEPDKAFAQRSAPLAALTLNTAGYVAKEAARRKFQTAQRMNQGKNFDGYFFEKFENEIEELARTVPAQQLANPVTWEHIYFNVKGRHADEIAQQYKDGKLEIGIESGSTGARGNQNQNDNDADKLTPQELKIAAKMGRTPEQFLEQKKKIGSNSVGVNV